MTQDTLITRYFFSTFPFKISKLVVSLGLLSGGEKFFIRKKKKALSLDVPFWSHEDPTSVFQLIRHQFHPVHCLALRSRLTRPARTEYYVEKRVTISPPPPLVPSLATQKYNRYIIWMGFESFLVLFVFYLNWKFNKLFIMAQCCAYGCRITILGMLYMFMS